MVLICLLLCCCVLYQFVSVLASKEEYRWEGGNETTMNLVPRSVSFSLTFSVTCAKSLSFEIVLTL